MQEVGVAGGGGSGEEVGGVGPWLFCQNIDSRGEAGGEELVWGKDMFGGYSSGSFPGCFSVLNSLLQKEVSNA